MAGCEGKGQSAACTVSSDIIRSRRERERGRERRAREGRARLPLRAATVHPRRCGVEGGRGIDRTKEGPNLPSAHVFSSTVGAAMLDSDTGSREDTGRGHGEERHCTREPRASRHSSADVHGRRSTTRLATPLFRSVFVFIGQLTSTVRQ